MIAPPPGYKTWHNVDPFEDHAGPFFYRETEDGKLTAGFTATAQHCNGGGFLHGGLLMTFADFALFVFSRKELEGHHAVTVTFNSEFIAAGRPGEFIEARGEVTHTTRQLIFVRGEIFTGQRTIMTFSGVLMRRPHAPA